MALPAYGVQQQFAAKLEASYDTAQTIAASDMGGAISLEIEPTQEWHPSTEHVGTASLQTEIEGKRGGRWTLKGYVKPRVSGTQPQVIGPCLEAAMGARSGSAFTLSADAPDSLQLMRHVGPSLQEMITGAWVEQVAIEVTGNQEPMIEYSGGFASYGGLKGTPVTSGTALSGASSIALSSTYAYHVRAPALVAFGSEDNGDAGYLVSAVATNGQTLTLSETLDADVASGTTVIAYAPTQTPAGTIQGAIACSLTIGGTSVGFISMKVQIQTGIHGLDKEATANRANRLGRGARVVQGTIQFYALDESIGFEAAAWNGTTRALVCRVGPDTANNRMVITIPAARLSIAKMDVPDAEEVVYECSFMARQSAAAEDEINIAFT